MLRSECQVVKTEEEQAGEAWARTNDELQRTTACAFAQSTHIFDKSKADNDKCMAELAEMTLQYQHVASELKRKPMRWKKQNNHGHNVRVHPKSNVMQLGESTPTSSVQLGTSVNNCTNR